MRDRTIRRGLAERNRRAQGRRECAMGRRGLRAGGAEYGGCRMGARSRHMLGRQFRRREDWRDARGPGRMGDLHDTAVWIRRPEKSAASETAEAAARSGASGTVWKLINLINRSTRM